MGSWMFTCSLYLSHPSFDRICSIWNYSLKTLQSRKADHRRELLFEGRTQSGCVATASWCLSRWCGGYLWWNCRVGASDNGQMLWLTGTCGWLVLVADWVCFLFAMRYGIRYWSKKVDLVCGCCFYSRHEYWLKNVGDRVLVIASHNIATCKFKLWIILHTSSSKCCEPNSIDHLCESSQILVHSSKVW